MARTGSIEIALPEFSGVTRRLVLANLGSYFALLILTTARILPLQFLFEHIGFFSRNFLAGEIWQLATYSFVQMGILSTLFALIMLWFMGSLLENWHGGRWLGGLYAASVLGAACTATLICIGVRFAGPSHTMPEVTLIGCGCGLFGLLTAIGVLHGDVPFRLFLLVTVKARYLAIIYALIALASAFGAGWIYALAELGAGAAALIYLRRAPRRGIVFGFSLSERWYGLRNSFYRWKRRRASAKFQVYMKKQGRTVRFDGQGRLIDEDDQKHDDRKRWN